MFGRVALFTLGFLSGSARMRFECVMLLFVAEERRRDEMPDVERVKPLL